MGHRLAGETGPRTSRDRGAEDLFEPDLPRDQRGDRAPTGHGRQPLPIGPGEDARPDGEGVGMNDEIERRLRQVTPRGAPPELRPQVLASVAVALNAVTLTPSRRPLRPARAVAAAVLASLALNYW